MTKIRCAKYPVIAYNIYNLEGGFYYFNRTCVYVVGDLNTRHVLDDFVDYVYRLIEKKCHADPQVVVNNGKLLDKQTLKGVSIIPDYRYPDTSVFSDSAFVITLNQQEIASGGLLGNSWQI